MQHLTSNKTPKKLTLNAETIRSMQELSPTGYELPTRPPLCTSSRSDRCAIC